MAPRRALIVGINTYQRVNNLTKCAADAEAMGRILANHDDHRRNYDCRILTDTDEKGQPITIGLLRQACEQLFADTRDDVLLYFSGHGALTSFGGHLCAYDSERNDLGVPMDQIMRMASHSRAREIIMIVDCCHAGEMADLGMTGNNQDPLTMLRGDMTVIAASLGSQSAFEGKKYSVFTASVLDALGGRAADLLGWVTAPAVYSYVEPRFGWMDRQRPIYKSHATGAQVIRECMPIIERVKLYRLIELFPDEDHKFQLDPEYEPYDVKGKLRKKVNPEKLQISKLIKEYRDAGLLKPSEQDEQLFHAAINSHTVQLTPRGCEYWWLLKNKRI